MCAGIVAFQRAFLPTIAFQYGGIQIQRVAVRTLGQTFHLPFGERSEEPLDFAHSKTKKESASEFRINWLTGVDRSSRNGAALWNS
jgi:hypothetical protein